VTEVSSHAIPAFISSVVDVDPATNGLAGQPDSASPAPDLILPPPTALITSSAAVPESDGQNSDGLTVPVLPPILNPPDDVEASNLPPCIMEFTAALEGGFWRLRGYVLDDSSTAGLTVHFSGILSAQATTDEYGHFELVVADSSVGTGWVFAHAIDSNGAESDCEQVNLYV
jgi:hypothetical protein